MLHRKRKTLEGIDDRSGTPEAPSADPIRWAFEIIRNPQADATQRRKALSAMAKFIRAQPARERPALLAQLGKRR